MVVNDDGSPPRRVAVVGGDIEDIRWSPDGKSLAYLAYFEQAPNERIYVASAAGSEQREVATLPSEPLGFFELFGWSRDGKRVTYAFLRGEPTEMRYEGPADLITAASDGSERKTVVSQHEINDATWLSDGRLAYTRNCVDVPCQLMVFNPSSRRSTPLTHFKWPGPETWGWDDLAFAQRPQARDIVYTHGRRVYEVSPRTGKPRILLSLRCPAKRCFPNDDFIALAGITGDGGFALIRHLNYSGDSVFMRAYRLDLNTRARRRIHLVTADPAETFLAVTSRRLD